MTARINGASTTMVALSHVANKLTRVIYAVLKGQRSYMPH
jgi:hypothetical protein